MHPGRVLKAVFMQDHDLNQSMLAHIMGCAPNKINEIVNGKQGCLTQHVDIWFLKQFSLRRKIPYKNPLTQ